MTRLFGTDGIRGRTNEGPVTAEMALRFGLALGSIADGRKAGGAQPAPDHLGRVVIGKDTRLSGYMIESALTAGLVSAGLNPVLLGPMPTPAVAMLTRSLRADFGLMITASHNPYADNGIKIFNRDGAKICDGVQNRLERLIDGTESLPLAAPADIGHASRLEDAAGRYVEFAKRYVPAGLTLDGLHIVLDCANGATYRVAPAVLEELGAKVTAIHVSPDGSNINKACGSTDTRDLRAEVIRRGAHLGIALDGDGDRLILCDERGQEIDGDQLIALMARQRIRDDEMKTPKVVVAITSNTALDVYLSEIGVETLRAPVGDRNITQMMRECGSKLGGESSGHLICYDDATTGDGLISALQVLAEIVRAGRPASEVCQVFTPFPQTLVNVPVRDKAVMDTDAVKALVEEAAGDLAPHGRLLVRPSGTEPLIRILGEGPDPDRIRQAVKAVEEGLRHAA